MYLAVIAAIIIVAAIQLIIIKRWLNVQPQASTTKQPRGSQPAAQMLLDTSAIIDGRIADVAHAGFVPGKLLVPRFVLAELQNIADSEDALRRGRGRRGLEMLNAIRDRSDIEIQIIEDDAPEIKEVDAKLVAIARRFNADLVTTDFNLNRVAQIEGVRVLNINELAQSIRPVVIPGEVMMVKVVQAGKEKHQGVGYLGDGTMIVVDQGDKLIGQEVETVVTRAFQTVAGKMIFVELKNKQASNTKAKSSNNDQPKSQSRNNQRGKRPQSNRQARPNSTKQLEDSLIRQTNSE